MTEHDVGQSNAVPPSQLVRDHLQANPAASPDEIVSWLRKFGIEITAEGAAAKLAAIKTG